MKMLPESKPALRISLTYAIFAGLWVLLSDQILAVLATSSELLTQLQTYKGWVFVVASAALIYSLLRQELNKRHRLEQFRRQSEESFAALVDQASDGFIVTNAAGKCIDVNQNLVGRAGPQVHPRARRDAFRPAGG